MIRRARIQVKPNIAKGSKLVKKAKEETKKDKVADEANTAQDQQKTVELSHVHFEESTEGTSTNQEKEKEKEKEANNESFIRIPRSRNVSMCDDESILSQSKRVKKKFTGNEVLNTKTMTIGDLAYWNPKNEKGIGKRIRGLSTSSTIKTRNDDDKGEEVSETQKVKAPQVKIGADGRLVIDEESLVINSESNNHSNWEMVEEGRNQMKTTTLSYRGRLFRKGSVWTDKETDLFYEVLRCTGPDFGLMHHYIPQRSRNEIKLKYNREERLNWDRLSKVLSQPSQLDDSLFEKVAKLTAEIERLAQERKGKNKRDKEEDQKRRMMEREKKQQEKKKNADEMKLLKKVKTKIASKKELKRKRKRKHKDNNEESNEIPDEAELNLFDDISETADGVTLEKEAEKIIKELIENSRASKLPKHRESRQKKSDENEEAEEDGSSVGSLDTFSSSDDSDDLDDKEYESFVELEERRAKRMNRDELPEIRTRKRTHETDKGNNTTNGTETVKKTSDPPFRRTVKKLGTSGKSN